MTEKKPKVARIQKAGKYQIKVTKNDDPNAPSFKQIVESKEYKEIVKRLLIKYGK